jgi:redox-sensitive bicupin YhaK (pirin superfamily)
VYLLGDRQGLKAASSSLHSEMEFGSEEKVNVASFRFTVP